MTRSIIRANMRVAGQQRASQQMVSWDDVLVSWDTCTNTLRMGSQHIPCQATRQTHLITPMHERQSPMKNLEVIFSLLELKFKCKNLLLIWGKHPGARIRWSHFSYVTHLHTSPFLCKSRKMSRNRTVDLENGCDRTRE